VIHVYLTDDGWAASGGTQARGYAHLGERFLCGEALAAVLDALATDVEWQETVSRLNGCFALVTRRTGSVLAAVDRVRTIPLFYATRGGDLVLSDSAYHALPATPPGKIDPVAEAEFRLTGYVTGRDTLYQGVHQVEAGELVRFDSARPETIERHRYHGFRHRNFLRENTSELIAQLEQVHARVFRRLVESTDGRAIVVPLSGGYDSRLIGISLRDMGIRNVICYTYGDRTNWEVRISEELARYLGFRWEFVPYSADRWRAWAALDRFAEYFREAGNLASVPHLQDWPAVLELQANGRIPPESVFVPGHSGDFLAGSHIPKSYLERAVISRREFLDSILRAHYSLWEWSSGARQRLREEFERRIESIVGTSSDSSPEQAADAFERWDLQERQAKFICNAVRVYEHFGFEWRLPLFDSELMDFWARIPVQQRVGRKLYYEFARKQQALPITEPNTDHESGVRWLIRGIDRAGLRPGAKRVQRAIRRLRWRREYTSSALAWFAIVDKKFFERTFTGAELFHSYMALRYLDLARSTHEQTRGAANGREPSKFSTGDRTAS
jgi:asparagine synthase (glutamine-hydrolysing)